MLIEVDGVRVGHWTDTEARTGCTAVLFPPGTVASGEVRGGAPATREFDLLHPSRLVDRVDVVMLSGGSAYGLAAADGAMRYCEEHDQGFPTGAGVVPIVVGMSLFDLLVGDPSVRPGPEAGYAATAAATTDAVPLGAVGAGTGCTIDKWRGPEGMRPGGLVGHALHRGDLVVACLVAVNAFGAPDDGTTLAGRLHEPGEAFGRSPIAANTTIGVVATNAILDKAGCHAVAQGAHDGLARGVAPTHTLVDGDAFVAGATKQVEAPVDEVRFLAVATVEAALRTLL